MKFWKKSKISQLKVDWWFLGLEVRWWWKGFISWLWCYLSVQFNHSVVSDSATPWTAACRASLSITNSWSLPNSCPLSWWGHPSISSSVVPFSSHPQSFPAVGSFSVSLFFASGGQSIGASASPCTSNQYSGLISFRMERCDLLAIQGTLKRLLQHHSSKTSILWHSAVFMVQLSHPYRTTGKIVALTTWTFVSKVMFLVFNMLPRLVIAFLPRSKRLLLSWL